MTLCVCVGKGEASWMCLVLGYRRHGVVFCSMTASDQLKGEGEDEGGGRK